MAQKYTLSIYRGNPGHQYWEDFELDLIPSANIVSALMQIQKNPINTKGEKVAPVVWEQGCLEEVCGSCSMLVNSKPRQACTALIEKIIKETGNNKITLAPFSKFPLVRDLIVDRSLMFENLKKVQGWIEVDGAYDRGPGPKISQDEQSVMYSLSKCMTCGCCVEACPQSNSSSKFKGPQIFAQVRLFNLNPTGSMQRGTRLLASMQEGGIQDCGNAQNCQKVCPKDIPLLDSLAAIGRDVNLQAIKDFLGTSDS
ncbi:MAG: succinate dehydrogenase iron-sulfur subunit [Parachlamydiaceae bacterium]|nr:succinate dehydrogenase iron-sulfur subunit [Parachlamydiaceae bacterium]